MTNPVAPAEVPVALLPIGLETRFAGNTLLVRIIPDEIHVEDHERQLTDAEVESGRTFWRQMWRGGTAEPGATDAERLAWTRLVAAVGTSRRAAWIADQTAPTGGVRPADPVAPDADLPDPPFAEPERRDSAWTRPAAARTLPDQFVAIAYRRSGGGGTATWQEIGRASGGAVNDSVQLGFDPTAPAPEIDDTGPQVPDGMRWMIDPAAAEKVGLLIRLNLPAGTNVVDRLVVLGVLTSADTATSAIRLADLLAGHHYTRGLELPAIGTPTNNTAAARSGFARSDTPDASFAIERRTPAPADGTDGGILARALGVGADTFRGVARSGETEQAAAGQMNALVWPASFGYWLDSLVQPGPDDSLIADIRLHAVQNVRSRGPLPPLRVGRQPYGVLPVTSYRAWQPANEPRGVVAAAGLLRGALPWWLDGVAHAPVVRAGADPDHGMLDVLSQSPVSDIVGVRSMVGANVSYIPNGIVSDASGAQVAGEGNRQRWLALLGFRALGIGGMPYLGQLVAHADPIPLLHLPYTVDPAATPEQRAAAWSAITTYLARLRGRTTADLKAESPTGFTSLLTLLARRSVMLERVRAGLRDSRGSVAGQLVEAHLRVDAGPVIDAQMIATTATLRIGEARSVPGVVLAGTISRPDGTALSMIGHLDQALVTGVIDLARHNDYAETVHAAEAVAALPPDRAALLLGESLDLASHRFDAWITSLATRRLSDLRAATPTGISLGAYGVVEELVRRPVRPAVAQPPEGAPVPLVSDASGAGYVHAPSLAQAATAAVLRAGHLAHAARDPNAAALAVDLSSSRVRAALELLDGVRNGQPIGALLGYRTERMLHERGAHTAVEVVRRLAPPPVVTAPGTSEGLPPRSVCDGLALSRMSRAGVLAAVDAFLVALGRPLAERDRDGATVAGVLDALLDSVDAVADLLLAESVHQVVRGNPDRAAAALDTLNRGDGNIVEPEVVRTPRTGTGLTHRVLIAIGADPPAAPGWPTDGVRAQAEPRLAAWAGHLLGDPGGLTVTAQTPNVDVAIGFAELGLGALDLVYEPLAPRVLRHARGRGIAEDATVDESDPALGAMLAVAEMLHELLTRARAGSGVDLVRPQDRGGVVTGPPPSGGAASDPGALTTTLPDVDAGARRSRLDAARDELQGAIDALAGLQPADVAPAESTIADALDTLACFGIAPGGDPSRPPNTAALIALRSAGAARVAAAAAAPDHPAALFGEGFNVLALVAPPVSVDLTAALAADPIAAAPAEVLAPLGGPTQALLSWLESHGRVRGPIGRLADVLLAARLRGAGGAAALRAIQLPPEPFPTADPARRSQWVGLGFPAPLGADPVTSLVVHSLGAIDPVTGVAVLVVDEFVEVVPAAETTTAVSFGFDAPGARPPQSVLLAVPASLGTAWTIDSLAAVVGETVDLAKIRMVDLSAVAWAGRFVPAIYLTDGDISSGLDFPFKDIVKLANQNFMAAHP